MLSTSDRFYRQVIPEPNSGCWLWLGALNAAGYGLFSASKRERVSAHRFSYEIHKGPIKEETIDHLCKVTFCVNPDHLEAVSRAENTRRSGVGAVRKFRSYCINGHALTPENLWTTNDGARTWRRCKRCYGAVREKLRLGRLNERNRKMESGELLGRKTMGLLVKIKEECEKLGIEWILPREFGASQSSWQSVSIKPLCSHGFIEWRERDIKRRWKTPKCRGGEYRITDQGWNWLNNFYPSWLQAGDG